jgi:hypothetical protein
VLEGPYSDAEIDAAVEALSEPERLAGARDAVARVAPRLQHVLNEALAAGGWFAEGHEAVVDRAVAPDDPDERRRAVRTLLAEETRLGMMVGVAVGLELARELAKHPQPKET